MRVETTGKDNVAYGSAPMVAHHGGLGLECGRSAPLGDAAESLRKRLERAVMGRDGAVMGLLGRLPFSTHKKLKIHKNLHQP